MEIGYPALTVAHCMFGIGRILGSLVGWKTRWLLAAAILVAGGVALQGMGNWKEGGQDIVPTSTEIVRNSLQEGWNNGPSASEQVVAKGSFLGGMAIRVGISFIVAMIAASFLKTAFKIGMSFIALVSAVVWYLDYQGYINGWSQYTHLVQEGSSQAMVQIKAVGLLLKDHLPSAGAATIGFALGLKR